MVSVAAVMVSVFEVAAGGYVRPQGRRCGADCQAALPQMMTMPADAFDWYYDGDGDNDQVGYAVSTAGDVNGDGYADVIVGAPRDRHTVEREGVAYVFYGSSSGLSATPNWRFGAGQKGARLGAAVGSAGDVNRDGYDDVVIGAPYYKKETLLPDAGRVYVFYGSAGGLSAVPDWVLDGEQRDARFGASVSAAGDVNGDGRDDILVGSPGYANEGVQEGRAYIFLGFSGGQTTTLFWFCDADQSSALLGAAVGTAGDVNGDGYDDVVVGAPQYDVDVDIDVDVGETDEGAAFVFYGSADPAGITSVLLGGEQAGAEFGVSVGTAGDVDGDGYDDLVVGAPRYDAGGGDEGAAFVFYGSASGLRGSAPHRLLGDQPEARFGFSVRTAGDVNGGRYGDVIVGAYLYGIKNPEAPDAGRGFLFRGSAGGVERTAHWTAEGDKAEAWLGYAVGSAGDVNGDGYDDIIVGAPQYKHETEIRGRVMVYHGWAAPDPPVRLYLPLVCHVRS